MENVPIKTYMLRVIGGRDSGRVFHLADKQTLLVGRDMSTQTRLKDPQVAMLHCQVVLDGEEGLLTDRGSSGGTYVDGKRVGDHTLRNGDVFRIGDTRIRFESASGAGQPGKRYRE